MPANQILVPGSGNSRASGGYVTQTSNLINYAQLPSAASAGPGATYYTLDAGAVTSNGNTWQATGSRHMRFLPKNIWNPVVNPDTATIATTGPGGQPPQTYVNANIWGVTSGAFTTIGCLPIIYTGLGSVPYLQNVTNASSGTNLGWWAVEFDYYGNNLAISFRNAVGNGSVYWVWVDGQPTTAAPATSTANSANSQFWLGITWVGVAQRRIRIYMSNMDFGGVVTTVTDAIAPTIAPTRKIMVVGDSYALGLTGATNQLTSYYQTLSRMMDAQFFINAYGGTGYTATGLNFIYGAAQRVACAATIQPDEIWFDGSVNDSGVSASTLSTAASACFSAYQQACPNAGIRVIGVQSIIGLPSAANSANNTALASIAAANGYTFVDRIGSQWILGSDHVGAVTTPFQITASCLNGVLNVTVTGGTLAVGQLLNNQSNFLIAPNTMITAQLTGSAGSTGTYSVTPTQTFASGTMEASGGNSGTLVASDGVHPTQLGHDYHAYRTFDALASLLGVV